MSVSCVASRERLPKSVFSASSNGLGVIDQQADAAVDPVDPLLRRRGPVAQVGGLLAC